MITECVGDAGLRGAGDTYNKFAEAVEGLVGETRGARCMGCLH